MDRHAPSNYCHTTQRNVADTGALVDAVAQQQQALQGQRRPLVGVAVTPRFVPTCSEPLLRSLGRLVAAHDAASRAQCVDVLIQTHVAESVRCAPCSTGPPPRAEFHVRRAKLSGAWLSMLARNLLCILEIHCAFAPPGALYCLLFARSWTRSPFAAPCTRSLWARHPCVRPLWAVAGCKCSTRAGCSRRAPSSPTACT